VKGGLPGGRKVLFPENSPNGSSEEGTPAENHRYERGDGNLSKNIFRSRKGYKNPLSLPTEREGPSGEGDLH